MVVHDATICTDYILHRVLHMLHRHRQIPSTLVLNKVDLVKQRDLIQKPTYKCSWGETKALFANIKGWSNFQAVFFVSALTGEGIENVRNYLCELSLQKVFLNTC
ncbi:unnamed protein product [Gongylonema pulchrum]|uniref:G domain-containing protein n=1 Tax=Gongylonema pulchrum TaxID=637853 RepID=A0A3P7RIZ1_9BILA|nr:unnamed protein product [Gongylonema pulchrum]